MENPVLNRRLPHGRLPQLVAALAAVGVLGLSGCGSSSSTAASSAAPSASANGIAALTADQALTKTKETALAQKSVHVAGKVTNAGQMMALDLHLQKGAPGYGSITVGGSTVQIVTTATDVYMKADKAFWTNVGSAAAAAAVGGRWVKAPASNASFKALSDFTNFDVAVADILKPTGTLTKGTEGTVSGQPALPLKDSTGGQLWIATTGDPLPIQIDGQKAGEVVAFSDWNIPLTVPVPAAADVVDFTKLGG
jgi:hypothetical protein